MDMWNHQTFSLISNLIAPFKFCLNEKLVLNLFVFSLFKWSKGQKVQLSLWTVGTSLCLYHFQASTSKFTSESTTPSLHLGFHPILGSCLLFFFYDISCIKLNPSLTTVYERKYIVKKEVLWNFQIGVFISGKLIQLYTLCRIWILRLSVSLEWYNLKDIQAKYKLFYSYSILMESIWNLKDLIT